MGSYIRSCRSVLSLASVLVALALAACGGADVSTPDASTAGPADSGVDARLECPNPEPAPDACDFFLSCGCDVGAGEKCSIDSTNHERDCFPKGTKEPGEDCDIETDCVSGSLCAVFGASTAKRCMRYCDDAHACPSTPLAQACYIPVTGVDPAAFVCGQVCDLLGQDCANADEGCYPSQLHVTTPEKGICAHAAAGVEGGACTVANDCAEGLTCLDSDSKCHKLCRVGGGEPACTTGTCTLISGETATGICL
jgi:hypothetical protein